jgi:hypothetical protein
MNVKEKSMKAIKELFEEVLDEGSLYFENEDGVEDEVTVDKFVDDWSDIDSAGIVVEINGINYTINISAEETK